MRRSRAALAFLVTLVILVALPSLGQQSTDREDRRERLKQCRLLLKESIDKINAGDLDSALVRLQSVLELDPKNPDASYHIGRIHLWRADTTVAMSVLAEGVENAPLSSRLKLFLARLKLAQGDLEGGTELLDQVLAIKPKEGEALYLRGLAYLDRGDTLQAMEEWESALRFSLGIK